MNITLNEQMQEDAELMEGLANRQERAFEKLYRRYRTLMKSAVLQIVHNDAEADDIMQEVLLQVWKRARGYSAKKGKLSGWLSTVARRRAIDYVRHNSAYRRATDRFEESCKESESDVHEMSAHHEVERHELRRLLRTSLEALPEKQREVVTLAYYQHHSQREIARITNTPLGTVKTRIELGLRKLHSRANSELHELK